MAQTIKIKRNTTNANTAPSSLLEGELAANILDRSLFIGDGSNVFKLYTGTSKWFDTNGYAHNALKLGGIEASSYATQSWVGDNYLSKNGGSLSGGLTVSQGNLIVSVGHTVTGWLYPKDDNASSLGQGTRRWSDVQTVLINGGTPIHSNNYSSYALPLTGGTITSDSYVPLILDTTNNAQCRIQFRISATDKALVGWHNTYGSWLYNYPSGSYLHIKDDGTPCYNGNPLIHSGNIGSQSVNYANSAGVLKISANQDADASEKGQMFSTTYQTGIPSGGSSYLNGLTFASNNDSAYKAQIGIDYLGKVFSRSQRGGVWYDWKQLAFTDSNVASATKLQNARTIWGKDFDGTANVSGNFILGYNKIYLAQDNENYYLGWNGNSELEYNNYYGHIFKTSSAERMRITTNGNIGINKPNPTSKLDISGDIKSEGANCVYDSASRTSRLCLAWASDIASVYAIKEDGSAYKNLRLGYHSITANNGLYMLSSKGYWGINNDSPAYALDVNGSIQASSALISKGATYDSVWTNGGYYCNGSYDGSSWGKGQGGLNIPITNNSSQTPLIVAMRRGNNPATAGATRLFAMECLNTGAMIRWYFGSYCALEMTSAGVLNVFGNIKVSGTAVSLEGHTHGIYYDSTISRTANTVLAAPNGSNGVATFRALVVDDIPSLDASKILSGTFKTARIPSLDASKISSGTLGVDRIPALNGAKIIFGEGTSALTDGTEILTSFASDNGFADTQSPNNIYRRKASLLYSYIKNKLDSVYLSQSDATKTYQPIIGLNNLLPYSYLSGVPTIYALTINNSAGTAQVTYTPNSKAATLTLSKSMVGLSNVENTALSTWAGTNKITTLGTITTGTWNGSKIGNSYLSNSSITIAGTSVSLGGEITAATLKSNLSLGSLAYKSSLAASDIPNLDWSKITSGKPTTAAGYGITDALTFTNNTTYVGASMPTTALSQLAATGYVELWDSAGWWNLKAGKYIVSGGKSSQFLKGDGSLDSNSYLLTAGGTITGNLIVNGTLAMGTLASSSDKRLKTNIREVAPEFSIEIIRKLKPTSWVWKKDGIKSYGFIAQDIQSVIPEMVTDISKYLHLQYNQFHTFEIGAIQQLDTEVYKLKLEIKELKEKLKHYESCQ